jgi:hypothetical protein
MHRTAPRRRPLVAAALRASPAGDFVRYALRPEYAI